MRHRGESFLFEPQRSSTLLEAGAPLSCCSISGVREIAAAWSAARGARSHKLSSFSSRWIFHGTAVVCKSEVRAERLLALERINPLSACRDAAYAAGASGVQRRRRRRRIDRGQWIAFSCGRRVMGRRHGTVVPNVEPSFIHSSNSTFFFFSTLTNI